MWRGNGIYMENAGKLGTDLVRAWSEKVERNGLETWKSDGRV